MAKTNGRRTRSCGLVSTASIFFCLQDWARILVKANRTAEACDVYEQLAGLAMGSASAQRGVAAARAAQMCLAAIQAPGARLAAPGNKSHVRETFF